MPQFECVPLLQLQRDLYRLPRSFELGLAEVQAAGDRPEVALTGRGG